MLPVYAVTGDKQVTVPYGLVPGAVRYQLVVTGGESTPLNASRTTTELNLVKVTELTNGTTYRVTVEAYDSAGKVIDSGTTEFTPSGVVAPGGIMGMALDLADGRPLTVTDAAMRRALMGATSAGSRWRYDFLRAQAIAAANDAARLDEQVASLVALDVAKVTSAEDIFTPYVMAAMANLTALTNKVGGLPVPDVGDAAARLSDAITTVALLERLVTWLASESQLGFWVGLFGALIEDIAAFDTALPRTRRHIRKQFDGGALGAAIAGMLAHAKGEVLGALDDLAAPLKSSVAELIEDVAGGLQAVFEAFDEPLLVPSGTGGPNDPLTQMTQQLLDKVDQIVTRVRDAVLETMSSVGSAGAAATLFEVIVGTYLVLPILAALAVGVAGGPASAVALAAAVTLAGQELIHLVTRWLTGPITAQLDAVRGKVAEATQQLKDLVAAAVPNNLGVSETGPQLRLLAGQLANLSDLVPDEMLHEAAALIEGARDVVLRAATDLALGAEQALGMEHATAFDLIDLEYVSSVRSAPRLPGGTGNGRFAAAALVRDIGRLDAARTQLLDGKDLLVTQRLSLFELLGGEGPVEAPTDRGAFAKLLGGEDVVVRLTEENVVDRVHPGLYRVLIADVKVSGVFKTVPTGVLQVVNVPVHVTHLGPSRTRVRRGANPLAPDVRPRGAAQAPTYDSPHAPDAAEGRLRMLKWGSAYFAEDRDPRVGSLGFATLVRELPPETAVFNLYPDDTRPMTSAGPAGEGVAVPFATRDAAQYRPFENRGIEGDLLVRLPSAVAAELLADTPASLVGGAATSPLLDLVLEVTYRACYDGDLAAAVRAAQAQRRDILRVASGTIGGGVQLARAVPSRIVGDSERRTVHVSLRAHRDETLRMWKAFTLAYMAEHGALPTAGADWKAVQALQPLGQPDAFTPLPLPPDAAGNPMPTFDIRFSEAVTAPESTGTAIAGMARTVTLGPAALGIAPDLAASASAGVVGVSVAVVPMQKTATGTRTQVRATGNVFAPTTPLSEPAICSLDRGLHVVGLSEGSPWETRLAVDEWQPMRRVSAGSPGGMTSYSSVEIDGEVHLCGVRGGTVYHAVRRRDGSWSAFNNLVPVNAQPPGKRFVRFTCVGVAESDGELHVAMGAQIEGATGEPYAVVHSVRRRDGSWTGLGDVGAWGGARYFTKPILSIDAAELGGEMHVALTDEGGVAWHTIRYRDGRWQEVDSISQSTDAAAGALVRLAIAGVNGVLHLCVASSSGRLLHSVRQGYAKWSGLGDASSQIGYNGSLSAVDCAELGGDLHVVATGTDGRMHYTVRRSSNGVWDARQEIAELARQEVVVDDPLAGKLKLAVTGSLAAKLPGFGTAATPPRLVVGTEDQVPVRFGDLFNGGGAISLVLPKVDVAPIYDVIVSLTYVVPVRVVETVPS